MFTIENKFYNNLKSIGIILISALVNIAISFQFSPFIYFKSSKNSFFKTIWFAFLQSFVTPTFPDVLLHLSFP